MDSLLQLPGPIPTARKNDKVKGGPVVQVWSAFVDAFINSCQAQGPAYVPLKKNDPLSDPLPSYLPPVERLVAIGDLHGDIDKTTEALRIAGVLDEEDRWVGGKTTVVQVGDQLDRGDNEVAVLFLLERMRAEARRAGGDVHCLTGNHETMSVASRFRYATLGGAQDFDRWLTLQMLGYAMKQKCGQAKTSGDPFPPVPMACPKGLNPALCSRFLALEPGGLVTRRFLAHQKVVLQVGQTVFAHGGLRPEHIGYGIDRINDETSAWMRGERKAGSGAGEGLGSSGMPSYLGDSTGVVWNRQYSHPTADQCLCQPLKQALHMIKAQRMVVGHTIQPDGINSACNGKVLRVDVGMSEGCYDAKPQVLEIVGDKEVYRLVRGPDGVVKRLLVPDAHDMHSPLTFLDSKNVG